VSQPIDDRIQRIYAAIGRIRSCDISELRCNVINTPRMSGMWHDFRGQASDAELLNDANSAIANVASLPDHLRKWAKQNERDSKKVDDAVKASLQLRVIMDLFDRDKHGGDRRDGGYSKQSPRLESVNRGLRLSNVSVQVGPDGRYHRGGEGTARIETYGTVHDGNGKSLGDLHEIIDAALIPLERLLVTFEMGRGL